ncbi:MAG: ABC-F family ATP-binding cassette domain-containing protein [Phycisphaerales bacterium]|jgi:ATP-binding cassette subfamily F protein uup|nr:ABC-F family ATP-binding cassette domain-containing protein [Phycisphaerales bacterium]MDP7520212.1 ABC-F family ATP-binding cassette domain-containing protein [Phycisphaerales bacterium]HCA39884.1 ABC transporter ATP-binding protein [Phycisphaerales bacterium]HJN80254.1 ABC-F family ATP-binding cassette domain-containing protein [Phycisphaerales bacterium]|tara:strand:+ start:713 stop:2512 length:1800 start_codon:yes stop_codon:yes gene_type:complete
MATLLSVRELGKSFPSSVLFEGVSLSIEEKDRVGLIGPNGAGKSTLLKILADLEFADEGDITKRRGLKLVYVEQDDRFDDGATPLSAICAELKATQDDRVDVETRAAISLSKLGFEDFDRPVDTLSGGWRKRLAIARALCHEPDVLLLDEPTNHLDLEGVLWLEGFAARSTMAMVFVTHDRQFLENTAARIIEISPAYPGGMFEAAGNYSQFIVRKEAFLDAQEATESALANKVRRDTAWLQQGIQGRQTRNKTQVEAAAERRANLKATKGRNEAPRQTTTIDFQATERKTKKLLALHSVAKSMGGKQLFHSLDLMLSPGRRIGLLGANGVGKTTLLRLMSGDLQPDSGTIKRAADLRVVTFSQHRDTLVGTQTLQEALCPVGDTVDYRGKQVHVTGWARRFLFEPDQLATKVSNLSGGEQSRVLIANLMLEPADVLLLDEPTNDLDIPSLEVLEEALLEFPGAIVLVTHDRFMLERIATEYVGLDDHGGIKEFQTLEQWVVYRGTVAAEAARKASPAAVKTAPVKIRKKKRSHKEEQEYRGMETAILDAEEEVARLEAESADPLMSTDHIRAAETFKALSVAQERVKTLYARWAELEK